MPKITQIRPVLLSAPYAKAGENLEVDLHLPSAYRTTGIVEITLEDGTRGLGEGYLAVFAPKVFVRIVELIQPYLIGRDVMDLNVILQDLGRIINYWSLQGAARHVYSAFEIALLDCKARVLGVPVYKMLCGSTQMTLDLYGSGGDSPIPGFMEVEFKYLLNLGIQHFKIRARNHQLNKAKWCLQKGKETGLKIAIDMTQNLADPGQSVEEVLAFYQSISKEFPAQLFFFEEVLGLWAGDNYPRLRAQIPVDIAGGETVTTPQELSHRIQQGWYDIAQPDATVIGGIQAVLDIFKSAKATGSTRVIVHSWGGPVGIMANYHAAIAGGGNMAEWPMPAYPLRDAMLQEAMEIREGKLVLKDLTGLGLKLSPEIESRFPFREDAVYSCLADPRIIPPDSVWQGR